MAVNKRYYWLKLKEDFFANKMIKKLRKVEKGDTCVIIYQKLLLLSLRDDGKLLFEGVENDFAEEITLTIDEEIEYVKITLEYLENRGLLEIVEKDKVCKLKEVENLVGSETDSTIQGLTSFCISPLIDIFNNQSIFRLSC